MSRYGCSLCVAALALVSEPAIAQSFLPTESCARPEAPAVIPPLTGAGWRETRFQVQQYLEQMDAYLDCLERVHANALVERNGVVQQFNIVAGMERGQ